MSRDWPRKPNPPGDRRKTDEEELERLRSGDHQAFERLVGRHGEMIYNLNLRIVHDPELAKDLTQETFIRAYRAIGRFRGESGVSTWLYRIAYHVAMDELGKARYRFESDPLEEAPADEAIEEQRGAGDTDFLDEIERSEEIRRAVGMIDRLKPEQRSALMLYYPGGKSYREISEIMGIPIGTVKTLLFRAKEELRRRLKTEEDR